jgi:hypothetical protein
MPKILQLGPVEGRLRLHSSAHRTIFSKSLAIFSHSPLLLGERSGDGLGHIWQCNIFGPYILVSPLTQQSHFPSTALTHNPHSHSLSTPSTEKYNPFWKPSTPGQTPTATIPPAFCGRLPSKLRIFTDLRTGNSWKPIILTKLRNNKPISSPPSSRNRPFCQKNRRIDPQKSGMC